MDENPESAGEQTLSFRAIRDDDPDPVRQADPAEPDAPADSDPDPAESDSDPDQADSESESGPADSDSGPAETDPHSGAADSLPADSGMSSADSGDPPGFSAFTAFSPSPGSRSVFSPAPERSAFTPASAAPRTAEAEPEGDDADESGEAVRGSAGEAVGGSAGEAVPEGEGAPEVEEELPDAAAEALTVALTALRESVTDLRFGLDLPGAAEARQAQAEILAQLGDYVLPRVRMSAAPALIVIAGSTGAGKSTLVNTLAEKNVSRTGVRRPTTGTPVLACHPGDREWFAGGRLLGNLRRVEAATSDTGLDSLVLVPTERLPQGVALLDTPDIDSVVEEHHEIAHRMLDAADLWIFVTTAARYADAPAWKLLRLAKERGARLAIVLSRVSPKSREVVLKHFARMLTEYGMGEVERFVIEESAVTGGRLPDQEVTELRLWLAELSVDDERRAQAVQDTLNGVLDSFRTRVPALARHLENQMAFRGELRGDVEAAYTAALAEIDEAMRGGALLRGEVLARWQDFAGSGDLLRMLNLRKRGKTPELAPERVTAFKAALRTGLESVILTAAQRASEEVVARWRHRSDVGAQLGSGLERHSDELVRRTGRAVAAWQEHLTELIRTDGVTKRSVSKVVSFDVDSLSLIFLVSLFGHRASEDGALPQRLLKALLGAESLRSIGAKAHNDLRARISMLFDEETMRYVQALDSAGIPDEATATRLYQATYNLEVAR